MKSITVKRVSLAIAGVALVAGCAAAAEIMAPQQAQAAEYKTVPSGIARETPMPYKTKIGNTTYMYNAKYNSQGLLKKGSVAIKAIKNGKSRILVRDDTLSPIFITNGKYLYYMNSKLVKQGKYGDTYRYRINRMTVASKKEKKVLTLSASYAGILAAKGNRLYVGAQKNASSGISSQLFAYNIKTHKKESFGKGLDSSLARIAGDRVIACGEPGSVMSEIPVYSFKLDGTDRTKIGTTLYWKWGVKGDKVLTLATKGYEKASAAADVAKMSKWQSGKNCRVYQCDSLGKNKKAVTGWTTYAKASKKLN